MTAPVLDPVEMLQQQPGEPVVGHIQGKRNARLHYYLRFPARALCGCNLRAQHPQPTEQSPMCPACLARWRRPISVLVWDDSDDD